MNRPQLAYELRSPLPWYLGARDGSGRSTVIVCSCFQVSDREVKTAIRHGACTLDAVQRACDAGTACGGCEPTLCALLQRQTEPSGIRSWMPTRSARTE